MVTLLSFALAMLVTTVSVPLCRKYAAQLGLVDVATEQRRVHSEDTPRSGGIAIVLGVLAAAFAWVPFQAHYLPLLACALVIIGFGIVDDMVELSYRWKLAGQVLAAGLFIYAYGGFHQVPFFSFSDLPAWPGYLLGFAFLLGVTNAVNLSDGLDGLAAGNGLLSLGMLALISTQIGELGYLVLSLAVAGGLVGFLRFNTHPAVIFMGDTGSQFLGFAGAALALLIMQTDQTLYSPMLPILIFGLPILDTVSVMAVRKLRRRPILTADRSHLHHQLLRIGFHHYEVVIALYVLQAICIGLAYSLRYSSDYILLAAYVTFCFLVLSLIFIAWFTGWQPHPEHTGDISERRNSFFRKLNWYYKNTTSVIATTLCALLCIGAWLCDPVSSEVSISIGVILVTSLAWVYWFRDRFAGNARLTCYLATAAALYGLLFGSSSGESHTWLDVTYFTLTLLLAVAIRITRRSLFQLDSQDYLVLLIIAGTPFLLPADIGTGPGSRLILYGAIMLYAIEYVVTKGKVAPWLLTATGTICLLLVALKS